jgi:outer membrane usher protein
MTAVLKNALSQGTLLYGVGKGMTLYGGAQLAQPYRFRGGRGSEPGGWGHYR